MLDRCGLVVCANAASAFPLGVRMLCEKKNTRTADALCPPHELETRFCRDARCFPHLDSRTPPTPRAARRERRASLAERSARSLLMVTTRRAAAARARAAAMAFSRLSGDEQGIILGQLRNALEPRLVMDFSSANKELRALLTPAARQQLRTDHEEATLLCLRIGLWDCKELREARGVLWRDNPLSGAGLGTLAKLGLVLPALEELTLQETKLTVLPTDGVQRLAEGLVAGSLPALTQMNIYGKHVGDIGALALAAALDRGALPRLKHLALEGAAIGDAGLAALAPALRQRPALESLSLWGNPLGDEGLAALVAPAPLAGARRRRRRPAAGGQRVRALPPPAGGLKRLRTLDLGETQVTDAGCAALAAALYRGALPALENLYLDGIPASAAAKQAAQVALARSRMARSE